MNIAVLVYGRLDKAISQYDSIVNNTSGSDKNIDFFLLLWQFESYGRFYQEIQTQSYINDEIIVAENRLNYFLNQFRIPETNIENVIRHFTNKKKRVYQLFKNYSLKNNTQYAIIISIRIDLALTSKLELQYPKINTIYIPEGEDWEEYKWPISRRESRCHGKVLYYFRLLWFNFRKKIVHNGFHPESMTKLTQFGCLQI